VKALAALVMLAGAAACAAPVGGPPPPERPFYVGVWAPRPENCRDFPWTIQESRLEAPGAVSCSWTQRQPTATGYLLRGGCMAEGAVQPVEIEVARAAPGRLTLDAQVWHEPVTLQACPRPGARP
jgi:hypothetical protein